MAVKNDTINGGVMLQLDANDRCDRCGARAMCSVTKAGFTELMFCNHHLREYRESLLDNYWLIHSDESPAEPVPASAYSE